MSFCEGGDALLSVITGVFHHWYPQLHSRCLTAEWGGFVVLHLIKVCFEERLWLRPFVPVHLLKHTESLIFDFGGNSGVWVCLKPPRIAFNTECQGSFLCLQCRAGSSLFHRKKKKQGTALSQDLSYSFHRVEFVFNEVSLRKNISCTYELDSKDAQDVISIAVCWEGLKDYSVGGFDLREGDLGRQVVSQRRKEFCLKEPFVCLW